MTASAGLRRHRRSWVVAQGPGCGRSPRSFGEAERSSRASAGLAIDSSRLPQSSRLMIGTSARSRRRTAFAVCLSRRTLGWVQIGGRAPQPPAVSGRAAWSLRISTLRDRRISWHARVSAVADSAPSLPSPSCSPKKPASVRSCAIEVSSSSRGVIIIVNSFMSVCVSISIGPVRFPRSPGSPFKKVSPNHFLALFPERLRSTWIQCVPTHALADGADGHIVRNDAADVTILGVASTDLFSLRHDGGPDGGGCCRFGRHSQGNFTSLRFCI